MLNLKWKIQEVYREMYSEQKSIIAHSSISSGHPLSADFTREGDKKYSLVVNNRREIGKGSQERHKDSEAKIIHYLMEILDSDFGDNEGCIELYTYREPCHSCENYILEFVRMFPNITLTIYYEIPYNEI
jgi:hypothetical protein